MGYANVVVEQGVYFPFVDMHAVSCQDFCVEKILLFRLGDNLHTVLIPAFFYLLSGFSKVGMKRYVELYC